MLLVCALASLSPTTQISPYVSKVFSDHMVLQRESVVPIWGYAPPGSEIEIQQVDRSGEDRKSWRSLLH
jgi:sialate O-acetylesterase